jgi:hypothetical protein
MRSSLFYRIMLMLLVFLSLTAGEELPASSQSGSDKPAELVWFNFTVGEHISPLVFPLGGHANYYMKESYSQQQKQVLPKKYFTLFDGYSQFWSSLTLICEPKGQ